jgi:hypothetical protein
MEFELEFNGYQVEWAFVPDFSSFVSVYACSQTTQNYEHLQKLFKVSLRIERGVVQFK